MDRSQTFEKHRHDLKEKVEVPMHFHASGQFFFVNKGILRLMTPQGAWVIPQHRIVWIPPSQLHSFRCQGSS
jgi:quercetin dioxygenase-like cupin family protein